MKVNLEIEAILDRVPIYINFSVLFDKDYGAYDYDWVINKITTKNHSIDFKYMDIRYRSFIENAIEERLYRFNFEDFADQL